MSGFSGSYMKVLGAIQHLSCGAPSQLDRLVRRGNLGVVSWTYDQVFELGQRFDSHSWHSLSVAIGKPLRPTAQYAGGQATLALVCTQMGDRSGMSISADSSLDETLNRCHLALLLRRQYDYEFLFGLIQCNFHIFSLQSLWERD